MKKIIVFILVSIFVFGCAPKPTKRVVKTYVFDFREYSNSGFFISSTPYIGMFDPIGEIVIHVYPAKDVTTINPERFEGDNTVVVEETISPNELLDILVKEAKVLGADGIVNMSISDETHNYVHNGNVKTIFWRYRLSGFAIKRK
jgi:uncharacterized protein YbjQ (UPF0145 family)